MEIVVLTRAQQRVNTYGRFTAEILKTEGLHGFRLQQWEVGSDPQIGDASAVILTPVILQYPEIDWLRAYVESGGRLIAFQPMAHLLAAFGAKSENKALVDAYVKPVGMYRIGRAIGGESVQFHGSATKVSLPEGWEVQAWLYSSPEERTPYPAVATGNVGQGTFTFFAYDLPAVVAAIRQGDPRLAYQSTAGFASDHLQRPNDLFTGHLDLSRGHIPQADVHCNLLTHVLNSVTREPLPRLWYFQRPELRSVVVMTSDDDWSTLEQFSALIEAVEEVGGHIHVFMVEGSRQSPEQVREWIRRGHSFSVHTNPRIREIDPYWHMTESVRRHKAQVEAEYGMPSRIYRSHCVHWQGYVESARILADLGFQMDSSVISLLDNWGLYVNGSGRPMRFVDEQGDIIDLFEQSVNFYDDASVQKVLTGEPDTEIARATLALREAADRYHTPFGFLSHPVSFFTYSSPFVKGVLRAAHDMGLPVLSADEWLEFTLARDAAGIRDTAWDGQTLSFSVTRGRDGSGLTAMAPVPEGRSAAEASLNGQEVEPTVRSVHGHDYAFVPLPAGSTGTQSQVRVVFR
ncbi:MAG: polysaccharide deacetylase family protein [Anaerolineae bacterium]|nr:polysaccharide deacetylase family protein [Anaerolineae bacterium]